MRLPNDLMTSADAVDLMKVSRVTFYRLVNDGHLRRGVAVGKFTIYSRSAIAEVCEAHRLPARWEGHYTEARAKRRRRG